MNIGRLLHFCKYRGLQNNRHLVDISFIMNYAFLNISTTLGALSLFILVKGECVLHLFIVYSNFCTTLSLNDNDKWKTLKGEEINEN